MREWIVIASVDQNWGIGFQNRLLVKIDEDMKFVSGKTKGKVIVMGRKTLESFPGGKPLSDRLNIVLTQNPDYAVDGAVIVHSMEELFKTVHKRSGEIFVFGGESIYRQLIPYCAKAYITKIRKALEADAYLPCLDDLEEWKLAKQGAWQKSKVGVEYQFTEYVRIHSPQS